MESAINKKNVIKAMRDEAGEHGVSATAGILLALVEIREAIEDGFRRIDQTNIEAALMLVGCKESLDAFLDARLKADKVLASIEGVVRAAASTQDKASAVLVVAAAKAEKVFARAKVDEMVEVLGDGFTGPDKPKKKEGPAEPADEQKKSGVTQEEENFGPIPYGSGKT